MPVDNFTKIFKNLSPSEAKIIDQHNKGYQIQEKDMVNFFQEIMKKNGLEMNGWLLCLGGEIDVYFDFYFKKALKYEDSYIL